MASMPSAANMAVRGGCSARSSRRQGSSIHTHACAHVYIAHKHAVHTHARTHMHTQTQAHTHKQTHKCTHTHTHARTHTPQMFLDHKIGYLDIIKLNNACCEAHKKDWMPTPGLEDICAADAEARRWVKEHVGAWREHVRVCVCALVCACVTVWGKQRCL